MCIISLIVISCSQTSVYLNPEYVNKDYSERELLIFPVTDDGIVVENPKDVTDDFPFDNREAAMVIRDLFMTVLLTEFPNKVSNVTIVDSIFDYSTLRLQNDPESYFQEGRTVEEEGKIYSFSIPKENYLKELGFNADLVYVINSIYFSRSDKSGVWSVGGSSGTVFTPDRPSLIAVVKFIIWDYELDKEVGYGIFQTDTGFMWKLEAENWFSHFNWIATDMAKYSPFNSDE